MKKNATKSSRTPSKRKSSSVPGAVTKPSLKTTNSSVSVSVGSAPGKANLGSAMTVSRSEKALEKAQTLWEETLANIIPFPESGAHEIGYGVWPAQWDKRIREIMKQRKKLAFSDGICYAFAAMDMDEQKKRNQREDYSI